MRISICEDELTYQIAIQNAIRHWQAVTHHDDIEISVFPSSDDMIDQLDKSWETDLLFIDIQLQGETTGIDLAHKIREMQLDTTIVFCTNYNQYVYEGYTVNALRFLRKPIEDSDIFYCCNYVYSRLTIRDSNTLAIISSGKRYVLRYAEIRYIEARAHNLYISTTANSSPLKLNASLSDILSSLLSRIFVLCHRSYIVNIAHIRMLTRTECLLSNNEKIPISRTYTAVINAAFDRYHQGGVTCYGMDGF